MKTGRYLVALIWASLLVFPACHPDESPTGDDDDATEVADDQPGPLHQTTWKGILYQEQSPTIVADTILYLSVNADVGGALEGAFYHFGGSLELYESEVPEGTGLIVTGTRDLADQVILDGGYQGYSLRFEGAYTTEPDQTILGDFILDEGNLAIPMIMVDTTYNPPASRPSVP